MKGCTSLAEQASKRLFWHFYFFTGHVGRKATGAGERCQHSKHGQRLGGGGGRGGGVVRMEG